MAASERTRDSSLVDERGNVVSIRAKSSLLTEQAKGQKWTEKITESFDVERMVIDSSAARVDLRLIEDYDDEVQQCIETRIDTLLGVDYYLDGGSQQVKDWLQEQVEKHYRALVVNAFQARLYGYSVQERIYVKEDGYWIVDRVSEKPFEWFIPKRDGTLRYVPKDQIITLVNGDFEKGVEVDTKFKFLLTRHSPTWRNPRGKALLALLFWPWFYRKATWQFWMQFLERCGSPLLVGKGPNPKQMAENLAAAVQDAVIGIPLNGEVDAISPTNRGEAFAVAEDRLVRRIQKVLLGQTLTSDTATKGSGAKSLGEVHNEVRMDKTVGDIEVIRPTLQNYIDALRILNFPGSRPVKLIYDIDRGLSVTRVNRDVLMWNTGLIEPTEEYIMREIGMKKGDFKIIPRAERKGKNSQPGQDKQGSDKSNEENRGTTDDDKKD